MTNILITRDRFAALIQRIKTHKLSKLNRETKF